MTLLVVVLLTGNIAHASSEFLDTIRYTQYDEELQVCPEDGSEYIAPSFEGGTEFFKPYFAQLVELVEAKSFVLKQQNVSRDTIAPHILVNGIYNDLLANNPRIEKVQILLGEDLQVLMCYEKGIFADCKDEQDSLYSVSSGLWGYTYDCNGWKANLYVTAVRIRPDGHATK